MARFLATMDMGDMHRGMLWDMQAVRACVHQKVRHARADQCPSAILLAPIVLVLHAKLVTLLMQLLCAAPMQQHARLGWMLVTHARVDQ